MKQNVKEISEREVSEIALTVRVPSETADRIDRLVRARPTKIPRHSWLLEAVYEKLKKEERVEGVLDIFWENNAEPEVVAVYRLRFLSFVRERGGPVAPMTVIGDDSLERYLADWGFSSENAKGWIHKLKRDTSVSVPNVMMPSDRVGPYGFKVAGMGIQMRLRDGRTAVLFHNHPTSDGPKGDKIVVLSAAGHSENEAVVTRDGKVFVIHQQHLATERANAMWGIQEASKEEADHFLDILRQFTLA
jgi:predicted transcriptional regulator